MLSMEFELIRIFPRLFYTYKLYRPHYLLSYLFPLFLDSINSSLLISDELTDRRMVVEDKLLNPYLSPVKNTVLSSIS